PRGDAARGAGCANLPGEAVKRLALLGATGSIGASTLDVVARHPDRFSVVAASLPEVDTVLAAIVGAAGLLPTLAAARTGKRILLANKEALVMGGALF